MLGVLPVPEVVPLKQAMAEVPLSGETAAPRLPPEASSATLSGSRR